MSGSHREYQKSKVYKWEQQVVAPRATRVVNFDDAQCFVDGIFLCEGLLYPPKIAPMPKQARRIWADANRNTIRLPEVIPAWVIIHELAHTLTMVTDGGGDHSADFMGMYLKLLDKYMGIPLALTMYSLQYARIEYNLAGTPKFRG